MDTFIEFLKMVGALAIALGVLAWLGSGSSRRIGSDGEAGPDDDGKPVDDMGEIGTAAGLLGGGFENLFVGRFALRRAKIARAREQAEARKREAESGD